MSLAMGLANMVGASIERKVSNDLEFGFIKPSACL